MFAMDPASTEFYDAERGVYVLAREDRELTRGLGLNMGQRLLKSILLSPSKMVWPKKTGMAGRL